MLLDTSSLATRRGFVAAMTATTIFAGSGCLGAGNDKNSNISEAHISVSNHTETEHEVDILVENLRSDERLVDERVRVPTDEILYFYFTSEPNKSGDYPDIRARASMVDDEKNTDEKTRLFPPSSGASFSATITDSNDIRISVNQV